MRGLEIAEAFYREYGEPMLREQFPELAGFVCAGVFGRGSECFGFDDDVSRDHDFDPGFMLLLPWEDVVDRRSAFLLERAYAKLPREYMGVHRDLLLPVGGARRGVLRTADVFETLVGSRDGILTMEQWLTIPEQALAEAVNGVVFADPYGEVTAIREGLSAYPEDIRKKKLAGTFLLMAQSGQYNYARCLSHGEEEAAQMALFHFVQAAMEASFLLAGQYMPYYKWSFRALRALPGGEDKGRQLSELLSAGIGKDASAKKREILEAVCSGIASETAAQELAPQAGEDLEKLAYAVNNGIEDAWLRNLNILSAV